MTLWWIGDVLLLVVILPVVIHLLERVLARGQEHRAQRRRDRRGWPPPGRRTSTPRAAAHHAGPGCPDGRGRRQLRRLPRRDPRRRGVGGAMPGSRSGLILAVVLIVLALVYYLVSTIVAAAEDHRRPRRRDRGRGEIVEKSAPVNEVVTAINEHLDAGVDLLEGLLVKKAGLADAVGLVDGLYPGAAAAGLPQLPGEHGRRRRRASARSTRRARSPSRGSGREAPMAAASPAGPVLRNVEGGSLAARALYPESARRGPRPAALAGDRHRRAGAVRAARGHRRAAQAHARARTTA